MHMESYVHLLVGRQGEPILWWQMSLRAVLIVLFGLGLVRLAGNRLFGRWGAIDIILSIIIGSNLSRALTGNAPFVETLVASAVIVGLHRLLVGLALDFPPLGPLLKGRAVRLVEKGKVDAAAFARCGVGKRDFEEGLRRAGLQDAAEVEEAWVERSGEISIIRKPGQNGKT